LWLVIDEPRGEIYFIVFPLILYEGIKTGFNLTILSCIVNEPSGTQKRKWRITLMRHVRRLQCKSVSQGILSLGLHDVTSYVRYDGGFVLTRAAVSSAMPRISSRAFLSDSDSYFMSNFFDVVSRKTYQ